MSLNDISGLCAPDRDAFKFTLACTTILYLVEFVRCLHCRNSLNFEPHDTRDLLKTVEYGVYAPLTKRSKWLTCRPNMTGG